jgi:hypothetical protein
VRWRLHDASTGLDPVDLSESVAIAKTTTFADARSALGSVVLSHGFPNHRWGSGRAAGPRLSRCTGVGAWRTLHRGAPAFLVDDGNGPVLFVLASALPHAGSHVPFAIASARAERHDRDDMPRGKNE